MKKQTKYARQRLVLGKEVRLRGAYVIKAERIEKDAEGNITTIFCSYDNETLGKNPADGRKVGVIHWVSADKALPAEIRLYDRLFTVANPAAADDFAATLNPESLVTLNGFLEPSRKGAGRASVSVWTYRLLLRRFERLESRRASIQPYGWPTWYLELKLKQPSFSFLKLNFLKAVS